VKDIGVWLQFGSEGDLGVKSILGRKNKNNIVKVIREKKQWGKN